jgi:hypothetical protein
MNSFGLLRTNVGLTTNIKVIVDSSYNLHLDSIDSISELSLAKYKKFSFSKDKFYDDLLSSFWNGLNIELSFKIKYEEDNTLMTTDFQYQYDELYQYGAKNIVSNKFYKEEFEYFAPLYVNKSKIPSNFIIFRIDGPGLLKLNKDNFKTEIISKFKTIKLFDMSKKTSLGQWIDLNFINNEFFPTSPLNINFNRYTFSKWNGINYYSGGYISKSFYLDNFLEEQQEIFNFEKFIFDNFKNNSIVFPNIINFSFLFDDTPANEFELKKWSLNRYYGFYLNSLDLLSTISPYKPAYLKNGVKIGDNNELILNGNDNPLVEDWRDDKYYYIEYINNYYKLEKFTKNIETITKTEVSSGVWTDIKTNKTINVFKIISPISLKDKENFINKNSGIIKNKKLYYQDGTKFIIPNFNFGDVHIIEINERFHNIFLNSEGFLEINSDYEFEFYDTTYKYYINKSNSIYTGQVNIEPLPNEIPKKFNIWRLNFTDIKDFDDRIVDTEYSKYEYEKIDTLTETDETKMYVLDLEDNTFPKKFINYKYIDRNKNINIPVSSEYTANHETFKISNGELSDIWRKNPLYCRWVYNGSLSNNDYPYLLNNSLIFEQWNRTTNIYEEKVSRKDRNLDYFYTINSSTASYLHHTLHVENVESGEIDRDFDFDFHKYFGIDTYITGTNSINTYNIDYFDWFFTKKSNFLNNKIVKNTKKYSTFLSGNQNIPNKTLFRGIEFKISEITSIHKITNTNKIELINIKNSNKYENYKFSILLTTEDNGMEWIIIPKWELDKYYKIGDIVEYDGILYKCVKNHTTNIPEYVYDWQDFYGVVKTKYKIKSSPYSIFKTSNLRNDDKTDSPWTLYHGDTNEISPFWNPYKSTSISSGYDDKTIIFKENNWYRYNTNGNIDFWNPYISLQYRNIDDNGINLLGSSLIDIDTGLSIGYDNGTFIIYKDKIYVSTTANNYYHPSNSKYWVEYSNQSISGRKWIKLELWRSNKDYNYNDITIYDDVVYIGTASNPTNTFIKKNQESPDKSLHWKIKYNIKPNSVTIYDSNNPYLFTNNKIYKIKNNPNNKYLDNGIRVIINDKWKNILINIYFNDNTLPNLRNSDRDHIYYDLYKKLTAFNFSKSINDISSKFDYANYLKYYFINSDNTIDTYDINNIDKLPAILSINQPDKLKIKLNTLIKTPIKKDDIKTQKTLIDNFISNINELNYYNNMSISNTISKNKNKLDYDYHLYRYSGEYTPLFYDIELFKKDNSSKYGEIQLIFNTSITDTYEAVFTRNGIIEKVNYTINSSTQDDIYQQIIKIITDYYSDINFIFQIHEIGNSNIWNTMDKNYSVLSIKWNMSYGDLGFDIYALRPKLSFNIEDTNSSLLFTLNANSGHPPYEFSFAYSITDDNPSSQIFSSDSTHTILKSVLNNTSYVSLTILVKDSYGALSEGGEYTINYGDSKVEIDKSTFQYKLIPNSV